LIPSLNKKGEKERGGEGGFKLVLKKGLAPVETGPAGIKKKEGCKLPGEGNCELKGEKG
jgi:hypothetical protein